MLKVKTSVSRITINGILFYKEVETNILFNPDTLEEVGVWNSITKTIDELPNDEFSEEEDEDENIFSDEDEDEEIPWCYENNKYAVCNCPQPCNPPSDDEEELVSDNDECILSIERNLKAKLEGHNLIKLLKKLPVTIINVKLGYSIPVNDRFISTTNDVSLEVIDDDNYNFSLENYLFKIYYSYYNKKDKTFNDCIFQILLNDEENKTIRSMVNF